MLLCNEEIPRKNLDVKHKTIKYDTVICTHMYSHTEGEKEIDGGREEELERERERERERESLILKTEAWSHNLSFVNDNEQTPNSNRQQ